MDYKNTLNLPRTDFSMKAELTAREPERLKKWEAEKLYEKIQATRAGGEKFVLHDGPPFANGDVHIGTALNKTLKDIIVKYKTLRGFSAPYVPGWDCHGLPIEFKVSQEMTKEFEAQWPNLKKEKQIPDSAVEAGIKYSLLQDFLSPERIRSQCRKTAEHFINVQREQFIRLGVLGDWQNPYLTLNKEYEADELMLLAEIIKKGFVYRAKKPVYWSIPCRTALAEAEVEYKDHVSQSVYVKFPIDVEHSPDAIRNLIPQNASVLIWTTTPWTLPANLAVAYNSNFSYCFVQYESEKGVENLLVLSDLAQKIIEKIGLKNAKILLPNYPGYTFELLGYQHPFINRKGQLLAGDNFVTSDTGTGFVHIAPGHGLDDYNLGVGVGLPIYSPVTDHGTLTWTKDLPDDKQMPESLIGTSLLEKHGKSEANEAVLRELRLRHALLHQENYHHSYPHCWRSKTPIIFRAMDQWFIEIDHAVPNNGTFREEALAEIGRVNWIPDWGINRIKSAVQSRPDWVISRQRAWGVPIPFFYDANGQPVPDPQKNPEAAAELVRRFANWFGQVGTEAWFKTNNATVLLTAAKAKDCIPPEISISDLKKSNDTLDVWIDSGSSSRAVIARRKEISGKEKAFQADMYLEGSDQHRGWFQSSLLLSLAGNGAAPYKTVLTHGFMVDADREKISKSKQGQGGYEKPQTAEAYVKKWGADVVRLWVASQDFRNDIVVSEERVNKVGETYRAIRNALRYQLSNLYDFDPIKHTVTDDKLTGLDRWILAEFSKLVNEVIEAYDKYEFHVVYQKISQFIAVELSAIYHDVIKDRLYTDAANSHRRRSTQTVLHRLVTGLCQMLSPILAFTADEAWEFVPGKNGSVHQSDLKQIGFMLAADEIAKWEWLKQWRETLLPELEKARQAKTIGKALDAKIEIVIPQVQNQISDRDLLRELLNVSELKISVGNAVSYSVSKADGQKCERCWHWEIDVGKVPEHPTICCRCVEAIRAA